MTTQSTAVQIETIKRDRRGRRMTPAAQRTAMVEGYRESGMTMEQFAKAEGIKRNTLAKWVYLHDQRMGAGAPVAAGRSFAQVNMVSGPSATWAFEVVLPNGWLVRAVDATALTQLLGMVQA